MVDANNLTKGDVVLIRQGEFIPCDGVVIEGSALVDESHITGESATIIKDSKDGYNHVTAGTMVISDHIKVVATLDPSDDLIDRLTKLATKISRNPGQNEKALNIFLLGFSLVYVVMCLALVPMTLFLDIKLSFATLAALLVCVLPTTIAGLISPITISCNERLLRRNIIVLGNSALEGSGDLNVLLIDKTGTITSGNRVATEFIPFKGVPLKELIEAAALSSLQDRTIEGKSIIKFIQDKYSRSLLKMPKKFESVPFSAQTRISGCNFPGNKIRKGAYDAIKKYTLQNHGNIPDELMSIVAKIGANGGTPLVIAHNDKLLGVIKLSDKLRSNIAYKLEKIKKLGIKIMIFTGDTYYTTKAISDILEIKDFIYEAEPETKIDIVKKLQKEGNVVGVIGDGVNDALALAQADVGFTFASSDDAVKQVANVMFLDDNPAKVIDAIEIGREMLITKGCLTTLSFTSDLAKYFIVVPALFLAYYPGMERFNILGLSSAYTGILSAIIFNALFIMIALPIAFRGIKYKPIGASRIVKRFFAVFGLGGFLVPFLCIKLIDHLISLILS
jgi:K+-transporting ATPase ATPase B chain